LHIDMPDGSIKAFKPANLRKVIPPQAEDPELDRVLAVFEQHDKNGDGILETDEFTSLLKSIGLSGKMLENFLVAVDKDGDGEVAYKEFAVWALGKAGTTSSKKRLSRIDTYFPEPSKESAAAAEKAGESDEEIDDERDLTVKDVAKYCFGKELPDDWPPHGITVVNNMHNKFPDYPIEGIIQKMRDNNYIGGKVMAAIRKSGTREVELVPASAVKIGKPGDFPAIYKVRSRDGPLAVYEEAGRDWSFQNMRDRKLEPVGSIPMDGRFRVFEVRRGNEFGFCFGRIEFEGKKLPQHWVVLGLELNKAAQDLEYSDAARWSSS